MASLLDQSLSKLIVNAESAAEGRSRLVVIAHDGFPVESGLLCSLIVRRVSLLNILSVVAASLSH